MKPMIKGMAAAVMVMRAAQAASQEADALKPGPGHDETAASCAICHTLNYIRMNSPFLTGDQWKAEVAKMRDAYGAPLDDDTAGAIVQYLSTNYGAPGTRS